MLLLTSRTRWPPANWLPLVGRRPTIFSGGVSTASRWENSLGASSPLTLPGARHMNQYDGPARPCKVTCPWRLDRIGQCVPFSVPTLDCYGFDSNKPGVVAWRDVYV